MKNVALFFSIFLLIFTSCSSDDSGVSEPELTTNGMVIKRIDQLSPTADTGGVFMYNGNKIDRIGNSTNYVKYTYTGNLITKQEHFENSTLKETEYYTYDSSERLIERKGLSTADNTGFRTIYTFNLDGTCSVYLFRGDLVNQNTLDNTFTRKVFFASGRVDKIERYMMFGSNLETMTTAYTYDDKHDPLNAILGYIKLTFYELGTFGSPNNVVSYTHSATNGTTVDVDVVEYTYNSYDFPTSTAIDIFDDGSPNIVDQFFYQQP